MKKIFSVLFAMIFAGNFFVSTAQAKIETCTGKGEYIMSMKETPEFAQQNAKLYAEREALEQAGVFVSSFSVMENLRLKKDEVTAFSAGLLKNVKVVKSEMIPLTGEAQGYIKVVVTVEATVDSDDFETVLKKWLGKNENERTNLVEQNNTQKILIDEQNKKIKTLERNLSEMKTKKDKEKVQQEIKEIDKNALYIQKIDEAWNVYRQKNITCAIEILNQAIEINPNSAEAYKKRGLIYYFSKNYNQSIKDYDKAIQLNPNDSNCYYHRGLCYDTLGFLYLRSYFDQGSNEYVKYYNLAIADYTKYIELVPNNASIYAHRGNLYYIIKNYNYAIKDLTKAIELEPNEKYNYQARGDCYKALGQNEKAEADFAKAKELGYKG